MSARFVIRKDGGDQKLPWVVRDALCAGCESHDFIGEDWIYDCRGLCDCLPTFEAALNMVRECTL